MTSDKRLCLRWNHHQNNLVSEFRSLLESETLVDCGLAAEGRYLRAHKVVLSACSPYFAMLVRDHHDKFPILILKDIKYEQLESLMNFVYRGEVNIAREKLDSFLEVAESLQIRGLTYSQCFENSIKHNNTFLNRGQQSSSPVVTETGHHSAATTAAVSTATTEDFKPSSDSLENNSSSLKLKKELKCAQNESLVETSMPSTFNCNKIEVSSQSEHKAAFEVKANVPSPSTTPKIESPRMDITPVSPVMCNEVPPIVNSTPNVVTAAVRTDGLMKSESSISELAKNELFDEIYMIEDSDTDPDDTDTSHLPITCLPIHNNQSESSDISIKAGKTSDISKEELKKEVAAVLKDADLRTMTSKDVRLEIEKKLDTDLTARRNEVDDAAMEYLDSLRKMREKNRNVEDNEERMPTCSAPKEVAPPKRTLSSDFTEEGSDEDDENTPKKKAPKIGGRVKGRGRMKEDYTEDSDGDCGQGKMRGPVPAPKKAFSAKPGFTRISKPVNLGPELAALVGGDQMPRTEVVKRIWAIVKERNLCDPENRQFAICDDELFKVFGKKRIHVLTMQTHLKKYYLAPKPEQNDVPFDEN